MCICDALVDTHSSCVVVLSHEQLSVFMSVQLTVLMLSK